VRALTAPAGRQTLVRLVLPPATPAGELEALVEVGDDRRAATVRVTGVAELHASPAAFDLVVEDGTATAVLQVLNVGNVTVELPDISPFGLMAEGAVETAIGSGLMTGAKGVERFGRFADSLAERHGGLARVSLESGAGRLEPGASTTVRARIRLGDQPSGGGRYHGTWPLGPLRIPVWLRVPEGGGPPKPPRARRAAQKGAPT
jgi:hypothetical protein